jgi:hypothetical protein
MSQSQSRRGFLLIGLKSPPCLRMRYQAVFSSMLIICKVRFSQKENKNVSSTRWSNPYGTTPKA